MKNSILSMMSVDEQKLSALIICLVAVTLTALGMYIATGHVDSNIRDIIGIFVTGIAGINVAGVLRPARKEDNIK